MRRAVAHRRRTDSEKGAVMVEFAVVALMLVALVAGTFDFGMAWRTGLEVNEGARSGARVGSGQGTNTTADFSVVTSVQATLDSSGLLPNVERLIIYHSDTPDGAVPPACMEPVPGGPCTVLDGAQVRAFPTTEIGTINVETGCIIDSLHSSWCPASRNSVQLSADYLGVSIKVRHAYTFKLLGDSTAVERSAVMRLEPPDPEADEDEVAGP